ncbi:MAG: macro domain-containing protein [Bacillota bacterium]
MLEFKKGNILESHAEAIINTVNIKGVMGKGIALQFKKAYPDMYKNYEKVCKSGQLQVGQMHVWHNPAIFGPAYIINFPTKDDWKQPSKLEYISSGLQALSKTIADLKIKSVAVPPLGCGNGGLSWQVVREMIVRELENNSDVKVEVYEPVEQERMIAAGTAKMTASRAIVLKLLHQYCVLGYELTLLEVQKLMFFLQEFGEGLRLNYTKAHYGPYADNIRHVLINFENVYTKGFGDGTHNQPHQVIEILPRAITEADEYISLNYDEMQASLKRLECVEKLIEGYETPFGLELLSTVYWLNKKDAVALQDTDAMLKAVNEWNPRKARLMKREYIEKAAARIYAACA